RELAWDASGDGARRVLTRATAAPPPCGSDAHAAHDAFLPQRRVHRSRRLWALLVDVEEAGGCVAAARAAYDRMLDLRVATAQTVVDYAALLEAHGFFEDSFRVYERGIALFGYPVAVELWGVYLRRFAARYGASKLERARDLYEQALAACPAAYAQPLFVAYGRMEEQHGLARRALRVYARATRAVGDRLEMFRFYAARTAALLGVPAVRAVYERGIAELADADALALALDFAQAERQLGEVDRARALYAYAAQLADPRVSPEAWGRWHAFEVVCGNEETFREMLRAKRVAVARFAGDAGNMAKAEVARESKRRAAEGAAAAAAADKGRVLPANPDEVAMDGADADDDL
ncbi:pre-mRNA-splicing factor syf1, partial [Kickxella alabastrina]